MHQSIPAAHRSPPPTGLLRGRCLPCQSWGWGICKFCSAWGPDICQPQGYSQAFDMHAVSYQNISTCREFCWQNGLTTEYRAPFPTILIEVARWLGSRFQGIIQMARWLVSRFQGILFKWLVGSAVDSQGILFKRLVNSPVDSQGILFKGLVRSSVDSQV